MDRLPGRNRTDVVNRALRIAVLIDGYRTVDGTLTVIGPDGRPVWLRLH